MGALNTYLLQTRRLLHDALGQFYSDTELTDDINQARNRVCTDTRCLRQLITNAATGLTLTTAQEKYTFATYLNSPVGIGLRVVGISGITVYYGTLRRKLMRWSFTRVDALLRPWQSYQTLPIAFASMGATDVYIAPIPDQAYACDWEVAVTPVALATDADAETIPVMFTPPIPFYAAYLAKFNEQSFGESQLFYQEYLKHRTVARGGYEQYVTPDPYRK